MTEEKTEFVVSRTFDAPRELVWQAWTEAERLAQWWGPKGFGLEVVSLDFRPEGAFHYGMKTPSGDAMWGKFVYQEIAPPERLVYVSSFADQDANVIRAPFSTSFPLETLNILTLEENDGKTLLTLRGHPMNATPEEEAFYLGMFASMQQGFAGTLDSLADYLAKV